MVKFSFRQRVGKINWNVVSAVSIQDVVEHLDVNELQAVLDAITFCEFGPSDIKNCPIDTVAQLVQIFQFTIEFLLYSQESQNVLIDRMHRKNTALKDSNRHLSAQVASLKEDTKIYQRQLLVLRQSMNLREPQNSRVIDLNADKKDSSEIQPIVASVLQSEKESREHLRAILEDQRKAFMKELELNRSGGSSSASNSQTSSAVVGKEESIEKLLTQMKDMLQEQQLQQRTIIAAALSTHAAQNDSRGGHNELERIPNERDALRMRKMQEETKKLQEEYAYRTRELAEKEENLLLDIRDFKNLKKADTEKKRAKPHMSIDDALSLKPYSDNAVKNLWEKSRAVSVLTIKSNLQKALTRRKSRAFRHWLNIVSEYKDRYQVEEHSRLLVSSTNSHAKREQDLLAQLQTEKQKTIIEMARVNASAKVAERKHQLLLEEAQSAIEKRPSNSSRSSSETNLAASVELTLPGRGQYSVQTPPSSSALALRQPLSPWLVANMKMRLGSAMTGDEALEMAMQRVTERGLRTPETPAQEHMNMLASEIATRLKFTDSAR